MAIKQPADKSHFILPDLGEGVHEAELIKWRVKPGERVEEHQTLAEMETDKALVEVPSPWAGVVKELNGKEGEILNVGSVLVTYEITSGGNAKSSTAPAAGAKQQASDIETGVAAAEHAEPEVAGEPGEPGEREDAGTVVGNMAGEMTISERFARRRAEENGQANIQKALATPAVRRIAREKGIDINRVQGSGRGGRVTATDIEHYVGGGDSRGRMREATPSAPSRSAAQELERKPSAAPINISADGIRERIPFRGVRRKIAEALDRSVRTAVHFTVVDEADVTALDRKRREYATITGRKFSYLPFVLTAVCQALRKHPALNANVDDANAEILIKEVINLGIAVDTEHGLMVPVIESADRRSLLELSDEVAQVAHACRDRTIPRERLVGGTFTISNVGSYGGLFATPIINYPEVGILAAGRVYEKVLTKNGTFYAGKVLPLSLSCDHRVVDGAEGARFLNTIVRMLEDPETLLG